MCFAYKDNMSRCIGCKVVRYCDKDCQKKDWVDHKRECLFMKNCTPKTIPPAKCRLIARIAMKLKRVDAQDPAFNGTVYEDLMDHSDEILQDPERSKTLVKYSRILREYMGVKYVPDSALLLSIYGKVEINSLDINDEDFFSGQGIYLGLSAHNHSCVPDAHIIFNGNKASLRSPDVNKNYSKDLTVCRTKLMLTNRDRKQKLKALYYINCTCARCSDPTLDFLYNSARSACCPDSYCLPDPDAKKLTCNKCGAPTKITVAEAVAANENVRLFAEKKRKETGSYLDLMHGLPSLAKAFEKFSKILSPLNINLLRLNDMLVVSAFQMLNHEMGNKYVDQLLNAYRHYLMVGDLELSEALVIIASKMTSEVPPNNRILGLYEEAFAAFSVSHGRENGQTAVLKQMMSDYRNELRQWTRRG